MAPVRDALRLVGVLVTYLVSRRPVRPLTDKTMRSLPGDEMVADAKIRWNHAIMQGGGCPNLKRLVGTA